MTSRTRNPLVEKARSHSVGDLLRRSAARYPDTVAIIDGERQFTYLEFNQAVDRVASSLAAAGLAKGDRVALLSHNCWQFAALTFATARLGLVLVPINFMLTAEEVAFILSHSTPTCVVVEDALHTVASQACEMSGLVPLLRGRVTLNGLPAEPGWEEVADWASTGDDTPPSVVVSDDDPIRLMYTSGTESRPKGVLLSSRSLISQYVSCIVDGGMERDDVDLHTLPLYHCAQLDCFLGPDIYLGATSVILSGPQPEAVLQAIERHSVTKFFAPPTVWIAILRSPAFDSTDLSSLRKGYYGASAMPVEVLKEIQNRLPALRLWNFYGQTELSPVATILPPEEQSDYPGSAGRPVLNVETVVVDDNDEPVPAGVVGEVVHRSPHATLGYWNDEAKTNEAFANGWFHSGDLGFFDPDGRLSIVDRKKDMIKTGGENVASREVEETVYLHPGVAEVAVFAIPDTTWIEAVTAAVVPKAGVTLTEAELRAHCAQHLAPYKTPKRFHVVATLPKNPSGKILKRDLRATYSALAEQSDELDEGASEARPPRGLVPPATSG